MLIFVRLIAFSLFVVWRISHKNPDAMWLWVTSIAGEFWFGFSWLLDQLPKLNPINRVPDLVVLRQRFDRADGTSLLPGLDIFVTTADPFKEPILSTANSILSILAADYPVEKNTCYLSDDSGMLLTYEAMAEAAKFATVWVPFCRKHGIEPRGPESYFELKSHPYMGRAQEDFVNDRRRVRKEYDEFKARINALDGDIRQRSDGYNAHVKDGEPRATWMADGTQWPGTWVEPSENHRKGDHTGIVQVSTIVLAYAMSILLLLFLIRLRLVVNSKTATSILSSFFQKEKKTIRESDASPRKRCREESNPGVGRK